MLIVGKCRSCGFIPEKKEEPGLAVFDEKGSCVERIAGGLEDVGMLLKSKSIDGAWRTGKLHITKAYICEECGHMAESRRKYKRRNYMLIAGMCIVLASMTLAVRRNLLVRLFVGAAIVLFVHVLWSVVMHYRNPWLKPDACANCKAVRLIPLVSTLHRRMVCAECGERDLVHSFRV